MHFAGSDNSPPHLVSANLADVRYSLFTCYPFIANKKHGSDFKYGADDIFVPRIVERLRKHVIMDSGLFTLMFGAEKGKRQTVETLTVWQDKTAAFVEQNNIKSTIVEIDCQKVLGVDEAWHFRERMKRVMPNNRHINVFHLEDGRKGLDRLIEYSDYIAISVPELRLHRPKTYKGDVTRLANYIKNRKPTIDIHLLGCTEKRLLRENRFCTSADSTSWLSANRYGQMGYKGFRGRDISQAARDNIRPAIVAEYEKYKTESMQELDEKKIRYIQDAYFSALISKRKYEKLAGSQE